MFFKKLYIYRSLINLSFFYFRRKKVPLSEIQIEIYKLFPSSQYWFYRFVLLPYLFRIQFCPWEEKHAPSSTPCEGKFVMLTGIALRLFTVLPKHFSTSSAMALVDVGGMRRDYPGERAAFDVSDLASRDPTRQFEAWFDSAKQDPKVEEANAMCLSTASAGGAPSSRMVLMKEFGPAGFVFFTNYGSRKGRELEENPRAALLFYWESSKRQVRIEGKVEKV